DTAPPSPDTWREHEELAEVLDRATEDDPKVAERGLTDVVAAGPRALPLLVATAKRQAKPTPPGRVARRVRAIVALGAIGDRSAVPVLVRCTEDVSDEPAENGWVRAAAVTALG